MSSLTLKGNYTSEYISYEIGLTKQARYIEVLVEDEYDIPFWSDLLNLDNKGLKFRISPYSCNENRDFVLTKGKGNILAKRDHFGPNLIACIDSDYDYLLPNSSAIAEFMNKSPYILQTYTYSVENYICHASTLASVCVKVTKVYDIPFQFDSFLTSFSQIIYDLFLWSVLAKKKDENDYLQVFKETARVNQIINDSNAVSILHSLKSQVHRKIMMLKDEGRYDADEVAALGEELQSKGLTKDNCYLFMCGHTLNDMLLKSLLKPLCKELSKAHADSILNSESGSDEQRNKLRHYDRLIRGSVESYLSSNFEYKKSCELFPKLKQQIDSLIGLITQ